MSEQDREARAGEYVIGTMPADERAAFERELRQDAALLAMVRAWEERLAGLADLVPEQAPDRQIWTAVERALERMTEREIDRPSVMPPNFLAVAAMAGSLGPLQRSRARWRVMALAMTATAAGLALFSWPNLRNPPASSYLAVVNRGGELPALVVEVDTGSGLVHVRSLTAEAPSDRSLELWFIAASGGAPRSLGLVGQPRSSVLFPAVAKSGDLTGATLAVSLEPRGGSTTGGPSGPVIYSGKLIEE